MIYGARNWTMTLVIKKKKKRIIILYVWSQLQIQMVSIYLQVEKIIIT